jgi:hypothetical protein
MMKQTSIFFSLLLLSLLSIGQAKIPAKQLDVTTTGTGADLTTAGIYVLELSGTKATGDASAHVELQALVNSMPNGGRLVIPYKNVRLDQKVTIAKNNLTVEGLGRTDNLWTDWGTRLFCPSDAVDMLEITGSNVTIRNIALENTYSGTPTSGSGILVSGGNPATGEYPSCFLIDQVSLRGFYNNINITNAYQWEINNIFSYKAAYAGVKIANTALPDGGDAKILNSYFQAMGRNGHAGIVQTSGGGLKLLGNKFNSSSDAATRIAYGYYGDMTASASSILVVTGNSFENYGYSAIKLTGLPHLSIGTNQFSPYNSDYHAAPDAYPAIDLINCQNVAIMGNNFNLSGREMGIRLTGCANVKVDNAYRNVGTGANYTDGGGNSGITNRDL